jgi:hypothetical protein
MIAIDTNVLSIFLYPNASVPHDFKTQEPIPRARERVQELIESIEENGDLVIVPAPALSEALVVAAPDVGEYVEILNSSAHFRVAPFGQRAAIEVALHLKKAKVAGDKRDGLSAEECIWDKINFDRQITAIAKVEGVSVIYSTDRHIHIHAEKWGIPCRNISELADPTAAQEVLFDASKETAQSGPAQIRGSGGGDPESQAGTENSEEQANGKEAGKD